MNRTRWQRVEEVVQAALDLAAEERSAFVERECGDDASLQHEVESLLAACAGSTPLESGEDSEEVGVAERRLGAYRLLQVLGRGGTATVYLAERADGSYRGTVAIKVLRESLGSTAAWRRFLAEGQILSSLDHPNIARLLDAGTTPDGRPYFVLEHIAGTPIDEYCDRHRLTLDERLELFTTVCSAVHCAHQGLFVHRDIKPSNILVTDDGVPKLLDFGIAKLLRPGSFPLRVEWTRTGGVPLTPAYASPEQLRGEPVTTASDIYSLGVLLYQLLCDRLPPGPPAEASGDLDERIHSRSPLLPSRVVAARPMAAQIARRRRTQPAALSRRLAGDVDTIVIKALRLEPRRRYASAESLAEDLRRYAAGLPVQARPPGFGYYAGKFLRRHRRPAFAAMGALAVLVSLTVGLFVTAEDLRREKLRAERSQRSTERVLETLVGVFTLAEVGDGEGEKITAGELLDRGAERVAAELAEEPAAQAMLDTALGEIYTNLGLYDRAMPLLRSAVASRRRLTGDRSVETVDSTVRLAQVYTAIGRQDDAERLLMEALQASESRLEGDPAAVAEVLRSLLLVYRNSDRIEQARECGERALEILEETFGADHPRVALALGDLASIHALSGEWAAAEPLMKRSLAILEAAGGPADRRLADAHTHLGILSGYRGRADLAAHHLQSAYEVYRSSLGERHPATANALNNLALLYNAQGSTERAEPLMRRALEIFEATVEPTHPSLVMTRGNLARFNLRLGRLAEAEALYLRHVAVAEDNLERDPDSPRKRFELAAALDGYGLVASLQRQPDEARARWRRGLAATSPSLTVPVPHQSLRVRLLLRLGRVEEARPLAARLLDDGFREPLFLEACRDAGFLPVDEPESYWGGSESRAREAGLAETGLSSG